MIKWIWIILENTIQKAYSQITRITVIVATIKSYLFVGILALEYYVSESGY